MRLNHAEQSAADGRQAVWANDLSTRHMQFLGVWTEKRAGLGEDAEPTLLHHFPSGHGLIGVYDGMGGSGARLLGTAGGDRPVSNAFAASRLAHLAVQDWFLDGHGPGDRRPLEDHLRETFEAARPPGSLKVRGTITKQLPTTAALIEYEPVREETTGRWIAVEVTARWAGDSRCYLLTPGEGLQQLSRDHSVVDDPLDTLMADQPLTNHVAAGMPFRLQAETGPAQRPPCVLLCATDGFFGYVASPALFEYHLLDTLMKAENLRHWGELLATWRRETAADDASLALVALNFPAQAELRVAFRARLNRLYSEHWRPLKELEARHLDDESRRRELHEYRSASWAGYRDGYLALLPDRPGRAGIEIDGRAS